MDQTENEDNSREQQRTENSFTKTKERLSAPKQFNQNMGLYIPKEDNEKWNSKPEPRKPLSFVEKSNIAQKRLGTGPFLLSKDQDEQQFPEEYYQYYSNCYNHWSKQQETPFSMKCLMDWSVGMAYSFYHSSSLDTKKYTLNELLDWSFALAYSHYTY